MQCFRESKWLPSTYSQACLRSVFERYRVRLCSVSNAQVAPQHPGTMFSSAKVAHKVGRAKSGVTGVSKELLQNTESVKIREATVKGPVKGSPSTVLKSRAFYQ